MVDPNRNFSKEQLAFLSECEEEFKHRYTDRDPEYRAALTRESEDPPIIHPWKEDGGQRFNNHRGGRGGGRQWQSRGHGHNWRPDDRHSSGNNR